MEFKYFVNEPRGIVTCKVEQPIVEFVREYSDFCEKYNIPYDWDFMNDFRKKHEKRLNKTAGMAKCNYELGEEFDIEFGKKLAKERYMKAFEVFRQTFYEMLLEKNYYITLHITDRAEESCLRRRGQRTAKINELLNSIRKN